MWTKVKRAVFPGSFDPVTTGHVDLIKRAASLFDELIIGILVNSGKEPLFTLEDRIYMLKEASAGISGVSVVSFDGLLASFVKEVGADVIVRGLRTSADFEYELPLAQANVRLNSQADTVFLATSPEYSFMSSSAVKELLRYNGDIREYVPDVVYKRLMNVKDKLFNI